MRKRTKKTLVPNSIHTRPEEENSENNIKKILKIKKLLSGTIFSYKRMRYAEKEKKKLLVSNSVHTRPVEENSENNSKKILKINKPLSGIVASQIRI